MSSSRTQLELTSFGLPLDHTQSATRTTDKGGDGGVARRIDCGSLPSANLLKKLRLTLSTWNDDQVQHKMRMLNHEDDDH